MSSANGGVGVGTAVFGLPTAWRAAPGVERAEQAEHVKPVEDVKQIEHVEYADLVDGLTALAGICGTERETVLLAAHIKVLGMLGEADDRHTEVDLGTGVHRLPVLRTAATWQELVLRVAKAVRGAGAGVSGATSEPTPAAGSDSGSADEVSYAERVLFVTDASTRATNISYGLEVAVAGAKLTLTAPTTAIAPPYPESLRVMYREVLEAMAADPDGDALAARLAPRDRELLLDRWSAGATADRGARTVGALIEAQAARTPDAPAVRIGGTELSYRELDARANRIARRLTALGARPDTLVGVCLRRTPDLLPALLGVWKSGAGYLPLDPSLPAERVQHMITAAGCELVISETAHVAVLRPLAAEDTAPVEDTAAPVVDAGGQRAAETVAPSAEGSSRSTDEDAGENAGRSPGSGVAPAAPVGVDARAAGQSAAATPAGGDSPPTDLAFVLLDRDREVIDACSSEPLGTPPADPRSLAYVIYTSGSTGDPKGVMVEHSGLANYLLWTVEAYAARGTGGAPVFSSISFDLGMPSLFAPLLTGQPVHLLPDPLDTADLGDQLVAGAPYSFIKMTPGHLDLLSYDLTPEEIHDLAGLVIAAGDAFTSELARRWIEFAGPGGTAVATEYGPTEITVGNSGETLTEPPATELIPLGAPIPNTTMYVLTDRLEPVPVGVPGEVFIGGAGVARGYLDRPALTAERFLPDPFGAPGARLYRTGDRARWRADGSLEFLGRVDHQVKIRGYRVELGEIQARLRDHTRVAEAVVIAVGTARSRSLAAYVIPADGQRAEPAELRDHLAAVLPGYMIPAHFVAIDQVPLTTNGKVDTRALQSLL